MRTIPAIPRAVALSLLLAAVRVHAVCTTNPILLPLHYRVGADTAHCQYDDIQSAHLVTPALTTVGISKPLLGAKATELLLRRLAGDQQGVDLALPSQLIVRASTRAM